MGFSARAAISWPVSIALALLFAHSGVSQVFTTSLTGLVTDASGGVIPGAQISLQNLGTQERRQGDSGATGRYTFPQLQPGEYELSVESAGFKRFVRSPIILRAAQPGEVNAVLELGEVTETVEVTAAAELLNTQSADRTVTLDNEVVEKLPITMRNPFAQVHATAGVTAVRTGISDASQDQNHNRFAMNGARDMTGLSLVDGAPSSAADWGGLIASPGVDSVQEVQLVRNAYDAQYGRAGGGVVSIVTKGGQSQFHGGAFWFLRNDNLEANSWDRNRNGVARPEFKRHQYGANLSGPIWKDKRLFFFFGYEALRQPQISTTTQTVPTALERAGDFSQSFDPDGSLQQIFDPFTTTPNPDGEGLIRDPFPNNVIPSNRFDPIAVNVLDLLPAPNAPGQGVTSDNNFFGVGSRDVENNRYDTRIDWSATDEINMYGRFTIADQEFTPTRIYNNPGDTSRLDQNPRFSVTYGLTWVPNPSWVVNFLATGGRWEERQIAASNVDGVDATAVGFSEQFVSQLDNRNLGAYRFDGFAGVGNERFLIVPRETHSASLNLTKTFASHSLKFGYQWEWHRLNRTDARSFTFNFNRGMTSGPIAEQNSGSTGNSIASALLGTGSGGRSPFNVASSVQDQYWAFYIQDDWRATSRLTVKLGLRLEHPGARSERHNRANYFDFDAVSPLSEQVGLDLNGGLVFVSDDNPAQTNNDDLNIAPRFGLAYKLTDRLVMRSGFGMSYMNPWPSGANGTDGFSLDRIWEHSVGNDGINPLNMLSNPFPGGLELPPGPQGGLLTNVGGNISAVHRENPTPYMINYSFDIQYEVARGSIFEIGYSGSQGRRLPWGYNRNWNQMLTQFLTLGNALNEQIANPFAGAIPTGPLSGPTIPRHRLLRLYPHFNAVNGPSSTKGAASSFNALYAKYSHRFEGGLTILSSYQWSKALDNASEDQGWEVSDTTRDVFDASLDRSVSAHDMPQSFVTSLLYELPVGRGRRIGGNMNKLADAVIGGWEIGAVARFNSGLPLRLESPNNLGAFGIGWKPVNIANRQDLKLDNPSPDLWFNTAAVSEPGTFEIGNAMRFLPEIRSMWTRYVDFTLFKNFQITERVKTELRGEFFNLFNTPHFGQRQRGCGNLCRVDRGGFGVITGTPWVPQRRIQLGLKLGF